MNTRLTLPSRAARLRAHVIAHVIAFAALCAVPLAPTFANPAAVAAPPSAAAAATGDAAASTFNEIPATRETLKQLRKGGFVLYLRHGNTDNSRPDRVPSVDLADCATQRPLTEDGRKLSARIGEAIRQARIPIAEIRISPLCRVRDTATAAFPGRQWTVDDKLMYTANLTDAQKLPILANTQRLLAMPVAPGSNRLLIAHAPNLMDLIGYFPKEGTLVIFRPRGSSDPAAFEYVASIVPSRWPDLLR